MGDIDWILRLVLFVALIGLSAFFSGSESAYFSLSKELIERLKEAKRASADRVVKLLQRPRHLLITILFGNTVVNVAAASVATIMTADLSQILHFSHSLSIFIEVVVVTLILLIFSELTPKVFAVKNSFLFAEKVSIPLVLFFYLFYPIIAILDKFPALVSGVVATRIKNHFLSKEELKTLIEISQEHGALEKDEREMIHSIFEFSQTTVREIMVPRIDMVCVEKNSSIDELIKIIKAKGHTRIPVYEEKIDNIIGIIHAKELLPFINHSKKREMKLSDLAREAYFVPETKRIDELLGELQREKQHMAIVVDEYGGTAGLITLEDVLEEIVGEIQDEYDQEKPLFTKLADNKYLVNAKIDLDELNEQLGMELPVDKNYESLGGLIYEQIGAVPRRNQEIKYGPYRFIVEKVQKNRIVEVILIKEEQPKSQEKEERKMD